MSPMRPIALEHLHPGGDNVCLAHVGVYMEEIVFGADVHPEKSLSYNSSTPK